MIATSTEYKRQLIAGNRNYAIKVVMTLADNTQLTLTNQHIWENGITLDCAISNDDSFDIGAAIISNLKIVLDNINETYSQYDFFNARLVLWLGVYGDEDEYDQQVYYRIGYYVVDETSYNGSLITLNCLDNMTWFDTPFSDVSNVSFPTTAGALVAKICNHVGVTLATASFPNYTTVLPVQPKEDLNCREVIQYIAQMCCCYCKINTAGALVLAWYDKTATTGETGYDGGTFSTNTTPYSDGDNLEGGDFTYSESTDYDGGSFSDQQNHAYLAQNYQMEVSTDDIVVTGCRVRNTGNEEDSYDQLVVDPVIEQTHERYVLVIENNPFITASNALAIATQVGTILAGLQIRAFDATSLSDFSYETGDMVNIRDFRGNNYYTWITHFVFTTNNSEQFSCGAESIKKKRETRYSESIKTLAEANANASKQLSDYDNAVKAMNELAESAIGYNKYQYLVSGSTVTWLYSGSQITTTDPANPKFPNSTNVFKITGDGVFISNDGGNTYTQGYDANSGTAILSLIYAIGLSADWINTGTLTVGGTRNTSGSIDVYDDASTPNLIGQWNKDGLIVNSGVFRTTSTYTSGVNTYRRGLQMSLGELSYIPPNLSQAAGYLSWHSSNNSSSTNYDRASLDIMSNGDVVIGCTDTLTKNSSGRYIYNSILGSLNFVRSNGTATLYASGNLYLESDAYCYINADDSIVLESANDNINLTAADDIDLTANDTVIISCNNLQISGNYAYTTSVTISGVTLHFEKGILIDVTY